jgi:hypothetical protein
VLVALVVVALLVAAVVVLIRHRVAGEPKASEKVPVATAKLELRDLSTAKSLPGTIGYGSARPLLGHQEATVTWLPKVGSTIKRGEQLYRADDLMVPLFYGGMPMYRDISGANLVGRDVRIVADNLRALGYLIGRQPSPGEWVAVPTGTRKPTKPDKGKSEDDETDAETKGEKDGKKDPARPATRPRQVKEGEGVLTPALIRAIKRWQTDIDRPATGTIATGDIEVSSGAVRVDSVAVQTGSPANAELLSVTSTRKVITVGAELADAASIDRGDRVTVVLPDERTAKARVVAVGRKLTSADDRGPESPKLTVTVTVNDPRTIAKLDSADVDVRFVGRTAKDVLVAPIEALVALREGGYAVQAPRGLVGVRTGMFADGWVEITGDGLAEGTEVVVSS